MEWWVGAHVWGWVGVLGCDLIQSGCTKMRGFPMMGKKCCICVYVSKRQLSLYWFESEDTGGEIYFGLLPSQALRRNTTT